MQQTFLRAIEGGGEYVKQPRNWLVRIVRNLAANMRGDDQLRRDRLRDSAVHAMVVPPETSSAAPNPHERETTQSSLAHAKSSVKMVR